jgi:hypothetical protein
MRRRFKLRCLLAVAVLCVALPFLGTVVENGSTMGFGLSALCAVVPFLGLVVGTRAGMMGYCSHACPIHLTSCVVQHPWGGAHPGPHHCPHGHVWN